MAPCMVPTGFEGPRPVRRAFAHLMIPKYENTDELYAFGEGSNPEFNKELACLGLSGEECEEAYKALEGSDTYPVKSIIQEF